MVDGENGAKNFESRWLRRICHRCIAKRSRMNTCQKVSLIYFVDEQIVRSREPPDFKELRCKLSEVGSNLCGKANIINAILTGE
jgi:hypothetical protein